MKSKKSSDVHQGGIGSKKSGSNQTETVSLASLNTDCLEFLFKFLELNDMLNIADCSKQFTTAVCLAFRWKYGNERVSIGGFKMGFGRGNVPISNPGKAMKLLRNFGHLICDVQLNFQYYSTFDSVEIERYLAEYCSKSLTDLAICYSLYNIFEFIETPFENVRCVRVEHCTIGARMPFKRIFPNIRALYLGANWYETPKHIREHFPALKNLSIQATRFQESDIRETLKLNPQLERLEITSYSIELIRCLNDNLPKLKTLDLRALPNEFFADDLEPIHFDNIVNFSIQIGSRPLHNLPFTFHNLKNILVLGSLNLNEKSLDFFSKLENLKSLTMLGWIDDDNCIGRLLQLTNILSNVRELNLSWHSGVSAYLITNFIKQSRALQKLTLNLDYGDNSIAEVRNNLSAKWKICNGIFNQQFVIEKIHTVK